MLVKTNSVIPLELRITDLFGQEKINITSVYFKVYHRVAGNIVEDIESTLMNGSGSLWNYNISDGLSVSGEYFVEYTITDDDTEVYIQTESLTVGYLEDDVQFLVDVEGGKWEIKNNQMIFYKADGVTEVARFNLFDSENKPSMSEVFKRVRV